MRIDVAGAPIDAVAERAFAQQRVAGLAICVRQGGEIVHAAGYGRRSLDDDLPMTAHAVQNIASLTKQFTAAAIFTLEEAGALQRTHRLGRYLPQFDRWADVTLEQLMGHVSGIPGYTEAAGFDRRAASPAAPGEVIGSVHDQRPAFEPGTDWQYSNTNFIILGGIVEQVAGEPFADVLARRFFAPLEMSSTRMDDPGAIFANRAAGYASYALAPLQHAERWHPDWLGATGGLVSNVADMTAWARALRSGRVISPASFAAMSRSLVLRDGSETGYGFGLRAGGLGGAMEVRHTGGLPGFATICTSFPEHDLDVAIFTNGGHVQLEEPLLRPIVAARIAGVSASPAAWPDARSASIGARFAPAQPEGFLRRAIAGELDDAALTPDGARYLTPARRAALGALARLGGLRTMELSAADARHPTHTFTYRTTFDEGVVETAVTLHDDGRLERIGVRPWLRHSCSP